MKKGNIVSEIDTIAVYYEGVERLPDFFNNENYNVYRRIRDDKRNDGEIIKGETIGLDTGRAFYLYNPVGHWLRVETSRKRLGCPIDKLVNFGNPDNFVFDYSNRKITRIDECVTLGIDLSRFCSVYAGPRRARKILFVGTGCVIRSGKTKIRIYDKCKENRKSKTNVADERYIKGVWWRIEVSILGARKIIEEGYNIDELMPVFPASLESVVSALESWMVKGELNFEKKYTYKNLAKFAVKTDATLLDRFCRENGGSSLKNSRRFLRNFGVE